MHDPKTLAEAIASFGPYPEDHPQTLRDLLDADPETISHPLAWYLRAQAVEVKRSTEQHYINSPRDAFRLLRNGYMLHPWTGKWVAYALSGSRTVLSVPHPRGGVTPLRVRTPIIPKADDLPKLPRSADGRRTPTWLVIYGGTPEVMSKPGVARGLASLRRRKPVADVLFFHKDPTSGVAPTLWSLQAGVGLRENGSATGVVVPFPDPDALEEARRT